MVTFSATEPLKIDVNPGQDALNETTSDDVTQQRRFIEGATMEETKSVCRSEGLRANVQEAL